MEQTLFPLGKAFSSKFNISVSAGQRVPNPISYKHLILSKIKKLYNNKAANKKHYNECNKNNKNTSIAAFLQSK
jgi:hypothetical protein